MTSHPASQRSRSDALRSRLSPELAGLAVVVIAAIVLVLPPLVPRVTFGTESTSTPSPSAPPATRSAAPAADIADLGLLLELDRLLRHSEGPLQEALSTKPLDTPAIRSELSNVVVNARLGIDAAYRLEGRPGTEAIGTRAFNYYDGLRQIARISFNAAMANEAAHRQAAEEMIRELAKSAALDDALRAAIAQAQASPSAPAPSPALTPSPAPTTPAPSFAPPSPSASPPSTPATGVIPGDLVLNGGFEGGPLPWELVTRDPKARAAATIDRQNPAAGSASLRIDINAGSDSRTGIAVQQDGIAISSDRRYVVRLTARAAGTREIRVAVVGNTGVVVGGRVFTIGAVWSPLEFEFTSLVSDAAASLEVDLGRSTATVWLDAVSLAPADAQAGG